VIRNVVLNVISLSKKFQL